MQNGRSLSAAPAGKKETKQNHAETHVPTVRPFRSRTASAGSSQPEKREPAKKKRDSGIARCRRRRRDFIGTFEFPRSGPGRGVIRYHQSVKI
ncbi:hypothetical protein GWI33_002410 [Rhynchophorus ferrugineus]|uniref:Uncharacterized protein n=1 Tax=Rhynchophorus ferrugineus TaxID=354439 RepID=A0A834MN51_RHYFE|nr:hypothetical protein GWI33_002410 [Rhynchophorus ferrugineus]